MTFRIVAWDTETTGIPKPRGALVRQPGIVQLAAHFLEWDGKSWVTVDGCNTLVNPEMPEAAWEQGAIEVHKITAEKVKDAPSWYEVGRETAMNLVGTRWKLGYNLEFDVDVIDYQNIRYGLGRSFPWPPLDLDVFPPVCDYLNAAGKRGLKNWKLSEAYKEIFGEELSDAHDADADIKATIRLFNHLSIFNPETGEITWRAAT